MWYNLSLDWLYLSPGYLYRLGVSTKLVTAQVIFSKLNIIETKRIIISIYH